MNSSESIEQAKSIVRNILFALALLPREGDPYFWREEVASGSITMSASLPDSRLCAHITPLSNGGVYYDVFVERRGARLATIRAGSVGEPRNAVGVMCMGKADEEDASPSKD